MHFLGVAQAAGRLAVAHADFASSQRAAAVRLQQELSETLCLNEQLAATKDAADAEGAHDAAHLQQSLEQVGGLLLWGVRQL